MTRSDTSTAAGSRAGALVRRFAAPVLIGVTAGFLSGLFGVGGGILIVPALVVFLSMPQRLAHGTSLACTILISLVGVGGYLAAGAVDVALSALIFAGSSLGVVGGTWLLAKLSQRALRIAFVGILVTTAVRLAFAIPESLATADITPLLALGAVALGIVTGVLSGLLGVGGGIVIVPALVLFFGVGDVVAKGTSLLVIIPAALIGTLRNRSSGNADLSVAIPLGLAGTLTALLGVRVATRLDPQVSTLLLAALLLITALRLVWSEVSERRRPDPPPAAGSLAVRIRERPHRTGRPHERWKLMKISRSLIALLTALAIIGAACGGDDADVADLADEVQVPAGEGPEPAGDGATVAAGDGAEEEDVTDVVVDAEPGEGGRPPVDGPWPEEVTTACAAESPTLDRIRDSGTLNWAIGISPPFGFRDASGEYAGVEIDNANELVNLLDVESNINDYSYDLLPPTLQTNQADIIGAQLFITPPRAEVIDFSEPYFLSGQLFYVLEDSEFQTIEDLNSPDNRFVYGTGNAQLEIAQELIPEAEIFDAPLRGQALLYDFLAADRADSSMTESQLMRVLLSQYTDPQLAAIGLRGRVTEELPEEEDLIEPFDVAFGLPKGDDSFKGCIDAWVGDLVDTGRMQDRIDFWLTELGS